MEAFNNGTAAAVSAVSRPLDALGPYGTTALIGLLLLAIFSYAYTTPSIRGERPSHSDK